MNPKPFRARPPAPAGTTVVLKDASGTQMFTVQIGAVTLNAASDVTKNASKASPATAGSQYLLFPVTYNLGGGNDVPPNDIEIDYVSAAGSFHNNRDMSFWYPGVLLGDEQLPAGVNGPYPMVIDVPSTDVEKGLISVILIATSSKDATVTDIGPRYYVKLS